MQSSVETSRAMHFMVAFYGGISSVAFYGGKTSMCFSSSILWWKDVDVDHLDFV